MPNLEDVIQSIVERATEKTVARVMRERFPEAIRKAQEPEWGGKEYVKERFRWTDRQLTYLRSQKRIRYSQHGRRILYHIPSLKEYIAEGTVQPRNGPLAEEA